jgi:glutamate racemase
LATPGTFEGALYASVVERFAQGVRIFQSTCPGLVQQIEAGDLNGPVTRQILTEAILPMLAEGIDTLVLGCTHYPFVIPLIEEISGPGVRVIDPAPAVARQVERLLNDRGWLVSAEHAQPGVRIYTSGNPEVLQSLLPILLGESHPVERLPLPIDRPTQLLSQISKF